MIKFRRQHHRLLTPPHCPRWIWDAVTKAMSSGQWEPGRAAETLEKTIARILGIAPEQVFATASCTAALSASTYFLSGPRVCPLTYKATWVGLLNFGMEPIFIDCNEEGWPVEQVDIGVELWGRPWPTDLPAPRILDSAHRALDKRHGEMLTVGGVSAVCYSFNCQKELAAFHGGAFVVSRDVLLANGREDIRAFLYCGTRDRVAGKHDCGIKGYLQDPLAAMVQGQIRRLGAIREKRQAILGWYAEALDPGLMLTRPGEACGSLCVLRFPSQGERDLVRRALTRRDIQTSLHYDVPEEFGCPGATALSKRILTVPCHMYLQKSDVRRIVRVIVNA